MANRSAQTPAFLQPQLVDLLAGDVDLESFFDVECDSDDEMDLLQAHLLTPFVRVAASLRSKH